MERVRGAAARWGDGRNGGGHRCTSLLWVNGLQRGGEGARSGAKRDGSSVTRVAFVLPRFPFPVRRARLILDADAHPCSALPSASPVFPNPRVGTRVPPLAATTYRVHWYSVPSRAVQRSLFLIPLLTRTLCPLSSYRDRFEEIEAYCGRLACQRETEREREGGEAKRRREKENTVAERRRRVSDDRFRR